MNPSQREKVDPGNTSGVSRRNCLATGAIVGIITLSMNLSAVADSTVSAAASSAIGSGTSSATTSAETVQTSEEAQKLLKSVSKLVFDYFPKAKMTSTDTSLHFEYKVHERMHPYNRRNVLSPDLDGILGDVEVKSGGPKDRIAGFLERPETVHSVLLMAPYSASDKTWVSTRLVFQPITPLDFMDSFKQLIGSYDHPGGITETGSRADSHPDSSNSAVVTIPVLTNPAVTNQVTPTTSITPAPEANSSMPLAAPNSEATYPDTSAGQNADVRLSNVQGLDGKENVVANIDPQKSISKEANPPISTPEAAHTNEFTASTPMDKYTYPEGRFKVMLPGSPQVKYSDQGGMRMVDYMYAVPEGTFNVSYVILPEPPANLRTSQLLDNMAQSVVNSLKGLHTRQYPTSLQGFPGCQLEVPDLANKAGQSARFKIYIVKNFIYIVGLSGKKDWLNSPNAKEFLETFQVNVTAPDPRRGSQRRR